MGGSVSSSRFVAESMSSSQSSYCPGMLLPEEVNQMCPDDAGDISSPLEQMPVPRCNFPFSFGRRLLIRHLLLPEETEASLVLPQNSLGETQSPGDQRLVVAVRWMLLSMLCLPLNNSPVLQQLLIKGS